MKTIQMGRFLFIAVFLGLFGPVIFFWAVYLQVSDIRTGITEQVSGYNYVTRKYYPERGNIYDRWGNLLAGNREVYEVSVDLTVLNDENEINEIAMQVPTVVKSASSAKILATYMENKDVAGIRSIPIVNGVTPEEAQALDDLKERLKEARAAAKDPSKLPTLRAVALTPYLERSYPEKTLASNILGFYTYRDRDTGAGYYGVEEYYNQLLAGRPVTMTIAQDPYEMDELPNIPPGSSLLLTIDREIQKMAEETLDEALKFHGGDSGTIIISNPRTGEIMAIATTPRMDPNLYWEQIGAVFPDSTPFNRGVGQFYEPGSVFKVLTMAAALDAGAVTPETTFVDTGIIYVGGIPIYNWNRGAWGEQNMTGCMQHSLNVCLSWIAQQLGPTKFYDYLQRFGIGHTTGVDLAGETLYPLKTSSDEGWFEGNLATNSFGQGLATTPMQMVMAASAIANDGKMMVPHVLKGIIEDGRLREIAPTVAGAPISAETARTLTAMLANSLEEESSNALVEGYRISGKTGTAQIAGPEGYLDGTSNASFVGWGPSDDPQFLVYVWIERPTSSIWGSEVAAPVFSELVEKLVVLMDLPPDAVRQQFANQ